MSKTVLILGGNVETGCLVEVANQMGLHTIVADPYPDSPAKKSAHQAYEVDVMNPEAMAALIQQVPIDGILVGVADPLVPFYHQLCIRHGFHSYGSTQSMAAFTSKSNFAKACNAHGIDTIPSFPADSAGHYDAQHIHFPVVVKPVDCGAGVGISVCHDAASLEAGINKALSLSKRKEIIVERFMDCDDMFAYYTFKDGQPYLSALADRYKTDKQGDLSAVCIAARYPSQHMAAFVAEVHPRLLKLFEALDVQNGVLLIQFFVEDGKKFYAYDPGFRLQGEAPHLYVKHINQLDQREMLLNFAVNGTLSEQDISPVGHYSFDSKICTTLWVLLKPGTIQSIQGLDAIQAHPQVIFVLQRFHEGDQITEAMLGTERQVLARIYTVADSTQSANQVIEFVHANLTVTDTDGQSMILDQFKPLST